METLKLLERDLPQIIRSMRWNSYMITWANPMESRVWTQLGDWRLSLQKFYPCDPGAVHYHNHPWRKTVKIVKGSVEQGISTTYNALHYRHEVDNFNIKNTLADNQFSRMQFGAGAYFTIDSPNCWHYMLPLNGEPVYAIMLTERPWFKGPKSPDKTIMSVPEKEIQDIKETILKCVMA